MYQLGLGLVAFIIKSKVRGLKKLVFIFLSSPWNPARGRRVLIGWYHRGLGDVGAFHPPLCHAGSFSHSRFCVAVSDLTVTSKLQAAGW